MVEFIKGLGLVIICIGLGLLAYQTLQADSIHPDSQLQGQKTAKNLLLLGGGIYLAGFALGLLTSVASPSSKCQQCGKTIKKGHVYCPMHQKEVVEKHRDRTASRIRR